ncbi:YtxH domain-containing protein [Halobacillus sp. Marseille-Q1614]|uniref:YtxH domain-containing protein n=1 Tax=Halobacillus sp. Marseille-Q1614 TaxID=2709134 RepID=UPI00156F5443|nr:YtxH domain-containing protein [Halobacillus sp. Marseille-Q1614]
MSNQNQNVKDQEKSAGRDFVFGSLIGGAVGAVVALLLAPKSGKELRGTINESSTEWKARAGEWKDRAVDSSSQFSKNITEKSQELSAKVKDSTKNLQEKVKSGKNNEDEEAEKAAQEVAEAIEEAAQELEQQQNSTTSSNL